MGRPGETADLVSIAKIDQVLTETERVLFAFQEGTQWYFRKK